MSGLVKKIMPEIIGLVIFNPNKLHEKAPNNTTLIDSIGIKFWPISVFIRDKFVFLSSRKNEVSNTIDSWFEIMTNGEIFPVKFFQWINEEEEKAMVMRESNKCWRMLSWNEFVEFACKNHPNPKRIKTPPRSTDEISNSSNIQT